MERKTNHHDSCILYDMPIGFALVKLVRDEDQIIKDFIHMDCNPQYEEIMQVQREELTGTTASIAFSKTNKEQLFQMFESVIREKSTVTMNEYFPSLDKWFKVSVFSPFDDTIALLFSDDDNKIKNLEERTSMLITLNGLIIVFTEEYRVLQMFYDNPDRLFVQEKDAIGKKVEEIFDEDMSKQFYEIFEQAKIKKEKVKIVYPLLLQNKTTYFEAMVYYSMDKRQYVASITDITKRKKLEQEAQSALEDFENFFTISDELMAVLSLSGEFNKANRGWLTMFNYTFDRLKSRKIIEFVHPEDIGFTNQAFEQMNTQKSSIQFTNRFRGKNGGYRYLEWKCQPYKEFIYAIVRDITEQKAIQQELDNEKEILHTTLKSIGEGVISTNVHGHVMFMSKVAEDITGWKETQAYGRRLEEIIQTVHRENGRKESNTLEFVLKNKKPTISLEKEFFIPKKNISISLEHIFSPIKDKIGCLQGVVLVFKDSFGDSNPKEKFENLSYYDSLTGIYNRRFYVMEMERLDKSKYHPISLIICDMNGLKLINDSFGHESGDLAIRAVAKTLQKNCRTQDVVARIGGDEFVVILPNLNYENAIKIAERIESEIAAQTIESIPLSISWGLHTKTHMDEKITDIFRIAEDKMYSIKMDQTAAMKASVVQNILTSLYKKSTQIEQHLKRVSELSGKIGRQLHLPEREIQLLEAAAKVHDIGKIVISTSILNKIDKLNNADWLEIKRHPDVGYRILSSIHEYAAHANTVLSHHERWDGTGYPRKLSGEAIPLHARIVAVADAFEVMITGKPYKDALPLNEAIQELRNNRGTQFDPRIVDVMLEVIQSSKDDRAYDIARYEILKKQLLNLSNGYTAQFPKKDLRPTTIDQFLMDHGFGGYVMKHSVNKLLYFGYYAYISLRALESYEKVLPWQSVQPYTSSKDPLYNVGLCISGTISTSDPRGTGAIYHNKNQSPVVLRSKHVYGYQGNPWGCSRFGIIHANVQGVIIKNYSGDDLAQDAQIILSPGDYLITLYEADRNALGGPENGYAESDHFKVGEKIEIIYYDHLIYRGE